MSEESGNVLLQSLKGILSWGMPALFGAATKLAFETEKKGKPPLRRVITSVIIACFVGYIVNAICINAGLNKYSGVIVAVFALISEAAVGFMFNNDKGIIRSVFAKVFGFKEPEQNENTEK